MKPARCDCCRMVTTSYTDLKREHLSQARAEKLPGEITVIYLCDVCYKTTAGSHWVDGLPISAEEMGILQVGCILLEEIRRKQ